MSLDLNEPLHLVHDVPASESLVVAQGLHHRLQGLLDVLLSLVVICDDALELPVVGLLLGTVEESKENEDIVSFGNVKDLLEVTDERSRFVWALGDTVGVYVWRSLTVVMHEDTWGKGES